MHKLFLAAGLTAFAVYAQPQDKSLSFDVASVKPATPPTADGRTFVFAGSQGGPGTKDPGRIHYPNMSLRALLMRAYDMKNYQVSGPAWLDTERFDITATMPPETTKEQFRAMLQNLLAERFKLLAHRETKELPMYSLVVAKNGPKIKESVVTPPPPQADPDAPAPPPPPMPSGPLKFDGDGFPILPTGGRGGPRSMMMMMNGRARMTAVEQTMQDLADRLSGQLNRPVTDATGLKGKYDFVLTYAPEGMGGAVPSVMVATAAPGGAPSEAPSAPDLFVAIQSQLGLKLEAKKGPVETIVVDHVEKTPTEN